MEIKIINNEIEYKKAIIELEKIGDSLNFGDNPKDIIKFETLSDLIKQYEKEHYVIDTGDPIEIIKLKMEYMGLKRSDLTPYMGGSKGIVSEVFNRKRGLSKSMIRELSQLLKIDQSILNQETGVKKVFHRKEESNMKLHSSDFNLKPNVRACVEVFQFSVINRGCLFNICSV